MPGEDREGLREAEAEQQVDDHVLKPDDRRPKAAEHRHLRVDQERNESLDILLGQGCPTAKHRVHDALLGKELANGAEHAILGHRVCVFMRIGHSRKEFEVRVAFGILSYPIGDLGDALMRRTHESGDSLVVCGVENLHDGIEILEAHGLGACLLFRHVIHAEELVVSEKQTVHAGCSCISVCRCRLLAHERLLSSPRRGAGAATTTALASSVAGPASASIVRSSSTRSVMAALAKLLMSSSSPFSMRLTK